MPLDQAAGSLRMSSCWNHSECRYITIFTVSLWKTRRIKIYIKTLMSTSTIPVLQEAQIRQKVRRIAFEIYENNFEEDELLLVGVDGQGYRFAQMLQENLQQISPLRLSLIRLELNKFAPSQSEILLHDAPESLQNKTILLADDVLNTGRTLAFSLKPFLQQPIKKLEIAVLVNRSHTTFPVQAKYTGYELSTTLSEHIAVQLSPERMAVYLQ